MKRTKRHVAGTIAACALLSLPAGAWACSCMPYPAEPQIAVEQAWKQAATIVRAKVLKKRLIPNQRGGDEVEVVLDVKQRWKGATLPRLRLRTPRSSAACGFNFDRRREYLVFATRDPASNEYSTNLCSLTRPLDGAHATSVLAREYLTALDKVSEADRAARREAQK